MRTLLKRDTGRVKLLGQLGVTAVPATTRSSLPDTLSERRFVLDGDVAADRGRR